MDEPSPLIRASPTVASSKKLGGGSAGVDYRAEDATFGRAVALKFLPADVSSDKQALERFLRKAFAAAAMKQSDIYTIHEIGEHESQRSPEYGRYRRQSGIRWARVASDRVLYARLDEKDAAFEWLQKAFRERVSFLINLKVRSLFDGLGDDPRFDSPVKRIGIPD